MRHYAATVTMPNYEGFMRPLLEVLSAGELSLGDAAQRVADRLALSEGQRTEKPAWSHEPLLIARTRVAAEWLAAAGLLARTPGTLGLRDRGRTILSETPGEISRSNLRRFPEFEAYLQAYLARQGA